MPRKLMKIIWKVLTPGSSTLSSPPAPASGKLSEAQRSRSAPDIGEGSFSLPVNLSGDFLPQGRRGSTDYPETQSWGENPATYSHWGFPGHNGRDDGNHPVHPAGEGTIDRIGFESSGYGFYLHIDHGAFWAYYF